MMDILQSAADNRERDGNLEPDAIKVKMKQRPPVSSIMKLTNVISSCVTVGKKKEVGSIYNSTNAIKKRRYSQIINANKTQVENTKTDNEKDNNKNNNSNNNNDDDDDDDDDDNDADDGDRDIRLKPRLYIDESRMETEEKQSGKLANSDDVCNTESKSAKMTELLTGGMVKKPSISVPELTKKENNVKACTDRFVRKSQDSSVQPNMSPDSTTYIGDDISLQKIQRKVSFIYVKNSFICLKCLKKFCGASLFRKHLWWHLHGNTLKDNLCPYCNSLTEKSKCPTVSKIVRLLISSASDSSISLDTNFVFGLEKMSHASGNGPHKNTVSQQLNNFDYYYWEKLKSKQVISSSVLEHGVGNVADLYDNDKTNKAMEERTDQSFTISDDAPLNLSINSAHKTNLFSDSKTISVYGNPEASLPQNYSQNSCQTFLNIEQNQLTFSGSHGVYFCQDCDSSYESTKSFYAHVLWHLECQLALCSPCMDQCDYLDRPTEKRPGRTCCLMAYIVLCLSEDDAVKKQLKMCWKLDEKHNPTFTVSVTIEGNTAEPIDVCKIIPNDSQSGYSVRRLNIKDSISPSLISSQEHLPVFNSSDLSSLITHNSDKTIPYVRRQSKGVITIILCQNIYECLNCKEEIRSHDLLISHLLWHFHLHDHLCTYPNCLTKQSCPVLNNVLPCIPVLDNSFNVQIPFFISWEVLPSGKTHFSVHFMNRYNKDKTDVQLDLSPASKDGVIYTDYEKGSRNLTRLKTTSLEDVSLTCLQKTKNTELSSGEKHNDKPSLSDGRGFSSNADLDKEKHQSPPCTPLSQKKSALDNNLTEVDNVPSQSTSETDPNDKKSSFEGFDKMSFICKSDQYICLDCSKNFRVLTHFKSHIMWHFHVLKKLCSHGDEQTFDCPILRNIMLCLPDTDKMTKTVEIHWRKESSGKTTFKVQTYYLKPAKPKVNLESHIDFTADNSDSDTVIVIDDIDDNEMLLRQSASSVSFDSSTSADTASSHQETTSPSLTADTNTTTTTTSTTTTSTTTPTVTAYKENGYGSSASISTTTLTEDRACSSETEEGNSSKTFPIVLEENSSCSSDTNLTQTSTAAASANDTPSTPRTESSSYAADRVHNSSSLYTINTTSIPAPSTISITDSIRSSPNTTEQDSVQTPTATPAEDPYHLVSTNAVSDSVHPTSTNGVDSRGAITNDQSLGCEAESVNEHSTVGGFYVCGSKDCKFSSLTPEPLSKHFTQVHSDAAMYPCVHCSIQTETSEKLLQHMNLHATNKMFLLYQCSILSCKFGTNLRAEFSNHLQFCHQSKSVYSCRYCKVGHPNVDSLIKHFESNLLKFIHCPHCNARDTSRIRILNHIRLKHSEKPRQIIVSSQIICAEKKLNAAAPLAKDVDKRTSHKANEKLVRPESHSDSSKATKPAEFTNESIHEEILDTRHSLNNEDKTDERSNEMNKESGKESTSAKQKIVDDTLSLNEKSIEREEKLLGNLTDCQTNQRKNVNSNKRKTGKDKTKAPVRKLKIVLKRVDNSVISKSENKNKNTSASPRVTTPSYKERNVFQLFNEIENSCQVNNSSAISSADCQEAAALNIDENASSVDNNKKFREEEEEACVEPSSPNIKETWFNEISLGGPMLNNRLKICFTTEQGKYKCLLCSAIFSTVYKIHLHLLSDHFHWPIWNCMDCGVRFYSLSKIRSHCWRKHKFKDHNIKPLPLPLITMGDDGKPFVNMTKPSSDSERRKSTEDESGEMTAGNKKAPRSGRKEINPVKCKKKKKSVKVPSKKTCKLCSFCYKKKMELIIHMVLSHNQELKNSISEKEVTLIEESIVRDESGKFICPFCEHSCKQRVDCKIHIWRVHVGLKYLNCQHCNFVTWFSSCLQKHEQEEHKTEENANSASTRVEDNSDDVTLAFQKSHALDSNRPNYVCDTNLSRNGPQSVSPSVNGFLEKKAPKQTHLSTVVMTLSAGDATAAGCKRKAKEPEEVTRKISKKSSVQHKKKIWKKTKSPQKKSVARLPKIGAENKKKTKDTKNLVEGSEDASSTFLSLFQQTQSESTTTNDQTN